MSGLSGLNLAALNNSPLILAYSTSRASSPAVVCL